MDLLLILTDLLLISTSFNTQPKRAHLGARSLFYYCSYPKHPYLIYRLHTVLSRIRFQASIPLAVSVEVAVSFQAITAFNDKYAISCSRSVKRSLHFKAQHQLRCSYSVTAIREKNACTSMGKHLSTTCSIITSSSYPCHPFYHAFPSFPY